MSAEPTQQDDMLMNPHSHFDALKEHLTSNLEAAGLHATKQLPVIQALLAPHLAAAGDQGGMLVFQLRLQDNASADDAVRALAEAVVEVALYGPSHPRFERWCEMIDHFVEGVIRDMSAAQSAHGLERPEG